MCLSYAPSIRTRWSAVCEGLGKWHTSPQPAVPLAWWAIPFRNLFFFLVVLIHVFRRVLPPY